MRAVLIDRQVSKTNTPGAQINLVGAILKGVDFVLHTIRRHGKHIRPGSAGHDVVVGIGDDIDRTLIVHSIPC